MEAGYTEAGSITRRGLLLVLSSPSGAGKTSISRALLERNDNLSLSISVTTRPKRPGEVSGSDYHFMSATEYNLMVNRGELLEHAKVFDHYYGTPEAPVTEALSAGRDILFDIDWQGTQQIAEKIGDDLVSVFILPPSTRDLEDRLRRRAQDSEEVIAGRMAKAADEMTHWDAYQYVVINDNFEDSVAKVEAILNAERLKRTRQGGLSDFVTRLRQGQ
jgi:guanylate kinase